MQRWRATLSYDGTLYSGWQIQPTQPTVQGSLAAAIHHLTGESTLPQGAGRTDTGVHALAQVAHFDLACAIPPANLHRALNRSLPQSVRVLTLTHCPQDFHARHSARSKTYEYRILPRAVDRETICPPFLAPYLWPCPQPLSLDLLNEAAIQILGTHDFTTFAAVNPDQSTRHPESRVPQARRHHRPTWGCSLPPTIPPPNSISFSQNTFSSFRGEAKESAVACPPPTPNTRTIHHSLWTLDENDTPPILRYRVTGSGFLHHMVRNLVGTFVECGASRRNPQAIPLILTRKNRQLAGPTAPPQGLFLVEVQY